MSNPCLSIGIPIYRPDIAHLSYLVDSLAELMRYEQCEVRVVVDDPGDIDIDRCFDSLRDSGYVEVLDSWGPTGMAQNWNRTLERSSGEAFLLLGQDDGVVAAGVVRQLRFLRDNFGVMAVGGRRQFIDESSDLFHRRSNKLDREYVFESGRSYVFPGEIAAYLMVRNGNLFGEPSCVLIRRSAAVAVGGYDESLEHAADLDLMLRLSREGQIAFVSDLVASRRLHERSLTTKNMESGLAQSERLLLMDRELAVMPVDMRRSAMSAVDLYSTVNRIRFKIHPLRMLRAILHGVRLLAVENPDRSLSRDHAVS